VTEEGRVNLSDHTLSVHRVDASEKVGLDDPAAVVDTLGERFGINIADLGDRNVLMARIAKLFEPQTADLGPHLGPAR
jgi:arylamine N-acetyltransferase